MRKGYKRLGEYIQPINIRNKDLSVFLLLGVSITKKLIPSIANTIGSNMANYKILEKNQFAYGPVTSRNGEKISVGLLDEADKAIISQSYTVFKIIDTNKLLPIYLMMWFSRPEFDRYARYHSHGSTRETFSWEEMCDVELPIPSIEKQLKIVAEYQAVENKIKTNEQICEKLEASAQALYRHWFVDFEFPNSPPPEDSPQTKGSHSPPLEGCPQDGVVSSTLEKCPQDGVVSSTLEKCPQDGVVPSTSEKSPQNETIPRDTKTYKSLPYNPKLKDKAKALRKAGNLAEVLFWKQVRNKQFMGLDFDRQKIIGNYIVDFYNANHQVVVEIDGSSHDNKQEYDAARDAYLESLGLSVIHITDKQVKKEIDSVMRYLTDHPAFQIPLQWRGDRRSGWSHSGEDNHKNGHSLQKDEAHKAEASQSQEVKCMGDVGKEQTDHPAFQAPLQRRGTIGYKSSGGAMVYNEELEKEIPEGWEVKELGDLAEINGGKRMPRGTSLTKLKNNHPYIRIADLGGDKYVRLNNSFEYVPNTVQSKISRYIVSKNDLIISIVGTIGIIKLIDDSLDNANLTENCVKITSINYVNSTYLYHYFKSTEGENELRIRNVGAVQAKLPIYNIKTFPISIPNQVVFDNFIVFVSKIDATIKAKLKENKSLITLSNLLLSRLIKIK